MAKTQANVRSVGWLALGLLLWVTTMIVAKRALLGGAAQPLVRAAMVMLGVGGFVAWLIAMVRFLASQDEFTQRVQLLSIAFAFVATVLAAIAGDFLQAAGVLGRVDFEAMWMLMIVLWWLGMIATARRYR